jgi:colanic acid biosynthesis glycosyl transferase WcaI
MVKRKQHKRKVLLLWSCFHPEPHAAAARGEAFAEVFSEHRHTVSVIADEKKNIPLFSDRNGYEVHRVPLYFNTANPFRRSAAFYQLALRSKHIKPDIIIASIPPVVIGLYAALIARIFKLPLILDVRDMRFSMETVFSSTLLSKLKLIIGYWLERYACHAAELIITVCPELKDLINKVHRIPEDRIRIIPNGVNAQLPFPSDNGRKTVDLIYAGYLWPYQEPERLVEGLALVAQSLPRVKIQIVGGRPSDAPDKNLWAKIKSLNLADRIEFVPAIPHTELPPRLIHAKVGLVSITEHWIFQGAIGTKIFDYLGSGLPVVCLGGTSNHSLKKIISENRIGFFTTTKEDFAQKVLTLLGNTAVRHRLSANALKLAKRYQRKVLLNEAFDVFENLLQ